MIVNNYTTSYLVLSGCSLILASAAAAVAMPTAKRWKQSQTVESRYEAEKTAYLIITLVAITMYIRLFLVPFWFWTLGSLVSSIPGAMCLAGVHLANSPISFVSSLLKFVVPFFYGAWLVLNRVDRKIESQPYTLIKLYLLGPLGLLVICEAVCDVLYFMGLQPRPVSCCTSLFDMPNESIPEIVTSSTWLWIVAFCGLASLILLAEWYVKASSRKPFHALLFSALATPVSLVAFVLALHTKASPLLLDSPYHHCVFCLWQACPVSVAFTLLTAMGLCLGFSFSWILLLTRTESFSHLRNLLNRVAMLSIATLLAGTMLFTASIVYTVLTH